MESIINKLQDSKKYWENILSELELEDLLINDFPMTKRREEQSQVYTLSEQNSQKLLKISKNDDTALFIVLLSSLNILISKISSDKDVCIGVPILKTLNEEYSNSIIVNTKIENKDSFRDILKKVKVKLIEGYKNYYYPITKLIKEEKVQSRLSPFRVIGLLSNIQDEESVKEIIKENNNDFVFCFHKLKNQIKIEVVYNSLCYKSSSIISIITKFEYLLTQMLEDAGKAINEYRLITEDEENKILNTFNSINETYPKKKTVHQLFDEKSRIMKDKTAVYYNGETLTYNELRYKSDEIASILVDKGVEHGTVVGIMAQPSLEMIIGILAILKAGAVYLPIDPEYPVNRVKYMLEDSQVKTIIIQPELMDNIRRLDYTGNLIIFNENLYTQNSNVTNTSSFISNNNDLAYILYTSGSTGKPKGVMIKHKGIASLVIGTDFIDLNPSERLLMTGSFAFDITTFEIWAALLNGLTLYLIDNKIVLDPFALGEYVNMNKITILHLVPQLFNQIATYNPEVFKNLEYFLVGGDLVRPKLVNEIHEKYKNLKILHMYGPTENTTFSSCMKIDKTYRNTLPIGKPVSNSTVYIFNENRQLQPIGIPGEIFVGGAGLALGYLNKSELTKERFVPNPYRKEEILYSTGDQGKWKEDGTIEFLGRKDKQVKIRSSRLEISEIETAISNYKDIRDTIIVVKNNVKDSEEEKKLCAYIVADNKIDILDMKSQLKNDIPKYMIPSDIIQIPSIPVTANGKVDYKELESFKVADSAEYIPARDNTDEKLIKIWAKVLGIEEEKIGIKASFFELGGHSLKITVLVSMIHKDFSVRIPITEIFKLVTISEQANYIKNSRQSVLVNIPIVADKEGYTLSSAQKRLYILQNMDKSSTNYNMTAVYKINGQISIIDLEEIFKKLINHHESLRTSFGFINGEIVQRIHNNVVFKVESYTAIDGNIDVIIQDFIRPFDLQNAPLLRVGLLELENNKSILVLDLHHIIADGISCNVLMKDFSELFNGNRLESSNITYKDYSEWQESILKGDTIKSQREYWLNEFSGEIPILNIWADYARPDVQSFSGDRLRFNLDSKVVCELNTIAKVNNSTIFMVFTTAFYILLSKLTNQEDIVIGTVTSGRIHTSIENIVGMFANTVPLRLNINNEESFETALQTVKSKVLGAFENEQYQFEDIINDLSIERNTNRNPLFDVMIVMQNMDEEKFHIPNADISLCENNKKTSKFDITMFIKEEDNNINIELEYCTKLFKKQTIQRMVEHFSLIIHNIINIPTSSIKSIDLSTEQHRNWCLKEYNNTQKSFSENMTIHEVFDMYAENKPQSTALIFKDKEITYEELKKQSDKTAIKLIKKGITVGDTVAIMINNSIELVVGVLAILKSGATYVPIDTEFPVERINFMLEDSGCKAVLLKDEEFKQKIKNPISKIYVDLDEKVQEIDKDIFINKNNPDNNAYIIYTSGSTGTPKGCQIKHKGVVNYIQWAIGQYFGDEKIYFPLHSSVAFDLTVTSLFAPLLSGNTVVIYERALDVLNRIANDGVSNIIKMTPTHLKLLLDIDLSQCSIKKIIVGGEQLTTDLANKIHQKLNGKVEIYNEYGPTEAVVGCMIHRFNPNEDTRSAVPIGVPSQNMQIYILDKYMNICPIGVVGEMYIGGVGVSTGYINRHELTKNCFVKNTFALNPTEYMYRTGDYAIYLENGLVEYVGRKDSQIKVRGHRIEIEEIESNILSYKGIKNTVVIVKDAQFNDKQIYAYIVSDRTIDTKDLKRYILEKMPEYMLPTYIIQIQAIPMLLHGKVDTSALGEPVRIERASKQQSIGKTEKFLYNIWTKNLQPQSFSTDDNFFEIGGNSFLLLKVHNEVSTKYPDIKVTDYFKYTTIREMSAFIEQKYSIQEEAEQSDVELEDSCNTKDIAIIGISMNLPKAQNLEQLKNLLDGKVDCISYPNKLRKEDIVSYLEYKGVHSKDYKFIEAAFLPEIDKFDYPFFRITSKEASTMDPYQRLFLQTAWNTFEDAGYTKKRLKSSKTGVYIGKPCATEYYKRVKDIDPDSAIIAGPGNIESIIASRISYMLDLKGPSFIVDSACSSALVAVHLGCQAIKNKECEMALVGGMNILIEPVRYNNEQIPDIASSTARARTFSDDSDGTGQGEGVISILLKPLEKAVKDKDNIYAVIKGSASNNDGSSIGITAPSINAQEDVLAEAWNNSDINPETLGYIEAHGTGTKLGDPIEIEAITNVFARYTDKKQFCGVGAIKTNYGHLDSAAGLLGLIKAVASLKSKTLLPNINFTSPNKKIDFEASATYVVNESKYWHVENEQRRRCGVSSFGLSGTNCHVVLEEYLDVKEISNDNIDYTDKPNQALKILPISAKTENSLVQYVIDYIDFLESNKRFDLKDICYNAQVGREHYKYRIAIKADTTLDLLNKLKYLSINHLTSYKQQEIYYSKSETLGNDNDNIAIRYVSGEDIKWQEQYYNKHKKISLPAYPFEKKRCWIAIPNNKTKKEYLTQSKKIQCMEQKEENMNIKQEQTNKSKNNVLDELRDFVGGLFDADKSDINSDLDYFELGIDSISIIQLKQQVKNAYKIEITADQLYGDTNTLRKLSEYIQQRLPEPIEEIEPTKYSIENKSSEVIRENKIEADTNIQLGESNSEVERIINSQLEIMRQQLELLRGKGEIGDKKLAKPLKTPRFETINEDNKPNQDKPDRFLQKFIVKSSLNLSENQEKYLDDLVVKYEEKTKTSKQLAQQYRFSWANGRAIQGFSKDWKELIYPIIIKDAKGARIWDVDDNEYVDFAMGFGANIFGYGNEEIKKAVIKQLEHGSVLGALTSLPGEVAQLLSKVTGVERVAFANSGTEAIMNLVRIARATTGKNKIAIFSGSFHGTFDGVYVLRDSLNSERAVPLSLGTPNSMVEDVIMLDYNDEKSLQIIRDNVDELAAVLVEPVQSRNPQIQPREYLHNLRKLTEELGIVLIFDEIITGFRIHSGGAQEYFNIEADLVAYGKILGGGLPLGIFAGKAKYMDRVDGGMWNYYDNSAPSGFLTHTGGTFCHHPLAMASAKETLNMMISKGSQIQDELSKKAELLSDCLNQFFEESEIPLKVARFGSLFIFMGNKEPQLLRFLYYKLIEKGFYLWEGATCFISTEHSEEDIICFVKAVKDCCYELSVNKCFDFNIKLESIEYNLIKNKLMQKDVQRVKLTENQFRLWIQCNKDQDASIAFNEKSVITLKGKVKQSLVKQVIQQIVYRHEALRVVKVDKEYMYIAPKLDVNVCEHIYKDSDSTSVDKWSKSIIEKETKQVFDLDSGPLYQVSLVKIQEEKYVLCVVAHHIIMDGWSMNVFMQEFVELYNNICFGAKLNLQSPVQLSTFANNITRHYTTSEGKEGIIYWAEKFHKKLLPIDLSINPLMNNKSSFGGTKQLLLDTDTTNNIKNFSQSCGVSLFVTLLGAYVTLLNKLTDKKEMVIGIPFSGQLKMEAECLIGHCVSNVPAYFKVDNELTIIELLKCIKTDIINVTKHQQLSYTEVIKYLDNQKSDYIIPTINIAFNMDRAIKTQESSVFDLDMDTYDDTEQQSKYDLFIDVVEKDKQLHISMNYNRSIILEEIAEKWLEYYKQLIAIMLSNKNEKIENILLEKVQYEA